MLNVKKLLTQILRRSIKVGTEINLGTVSLNSSGYAQFSLGDSCPNPCFVIGFEMNWSANSGAFSVLPYGSGFTASARAQYIVGTPNATITNLRLTPIYFDV